MTLKLKHLVLASALVPLLANAQFSDNKIKIGVLTDMSGIFADFSGSGSVESAKMAVEKLGGKIAGMPVEVVFADHQNKVDVGATIARKWFDSEGVDLIMDLPQSAVALAVADLAKTKGKAVIFASAASSILTGKNCTPNTVMWGWDSWAHATNTAREVVKHGGDTWFSLMADYAYGRALADDVGNAVKSAGGKMVGGVFYPFDTQDFSSFLLTVSASKAKVIALSGGSDATIIKQAIEFGLTRGGQQFAGTVQPISNIRAMGLDVAQGMYLSTAFYWDLNDATRAFAKGLSARNKGTYPSMPQAAIYSSVLHYAKAVEKAKTDNGTKVIAAMKQVPIDDEFFGKTRVREDGRALLPLYLMQVKSPKESTGPYDFYKKITVTPGDKAYQPMADAGCPLVKQ